MRRASSSADRPVREPVIERREYARRRRRLLEDAGEGCAIIVPAAPVVHRNRDIEYPYRPRQRLLLSHGVSGAGRGGSPPARPRGRRVPALLPRARPARGANAGPQRGPRGRLWPIRRGRRVSHRRHRRDPAPPPRGPPAHLVLDGRVPRVRRAGARLARAASLPPGGPVGAGGPAPSRSRDAALQEPGGGAHDPSGGRAHRARAPPCDGGLPGRGSRSTRWRRRSSTSSIAPAVGPSPIRASWRPAPTPADRTTPRTPGPFARATSCWWTRERSTGATPPT